MHSSDSNQKRERENKRKREWRAKKKQEKEKKTIYKSVPTPKVERHIVKSAQKEQAMTHRKGPAIKFADRPIVVQQPEKKKSLFRRRERRPERNRHIEREDVPDVIAEQTERMPYQTEFCPEAVLELKQIRQNPENYIEINVIKKSRVVDVFCIPVDKKRFHYKKLEYKIHEDGLYLMPTKAGLLMPSAYYREGKTDPSMFKNTNKGITGKALSLLYKEELYRQILFAEDPKYNLFIVILLIALLIAFGVGAYFVFVHGGGIINPLPPGGGAPIQ